MTTKIQIGIPQTGLAACSSGPQLMPFHIAHSGPAPISTFFRVKDAAVDAPTRGAGSSSVMVPVSAAEGSTMKALDVPAGAETNSRTSPRRRLIAAFRGRRLVGLDVPLPDGYTGFVLRSDPSGRGAQSSSSKAAAQSSEIIKNGRGKGRAPGRRTRRAQDEDEMENYEDQTTIGTDEVVGDIMPAPAEDVEIRMLRPIGTFVSFMVWSPDIAVDEGQDEYMRALKEWTAVVAEVSDKSTFNHSKAKTSVGA